MVVALLLAWGLVFNLTKLPYTLWFKNLKVWLDRNARASNFDFFNPGLNDCRTTQIEGNAGDVILWSTKLPHGSAVNLSNRPRIAAFVSMQPAADSAELRASMKKWWLTKQAPDYGEVCLDSSRQSLGRPRTCRS